MAGVTIAPARPPVPRLRVLPAPMPVKPGELTTPPLATVSVPTRQSQGSPMTSDVSAFNTEPGPVTVANELPVRASPIPTAALTFTVPPLAIVSVPGPGVVPLPTARPTPPTFQVEPRPVTVADGWPRLGVRVNASISAPPWLLSTPPLLIASEDVNDVTGPKTPTTVGPPVTVTLEPGPETIMLVAIRRAAGDAREPTCSVPPLITASVPPRTDTPVLKLLTVSEPPLIVSPPEEQLHSVRSPPMVPMLPPLLAPVSVRAAPLSSSSEPAPEKRPENVALPLPTMLRTVVGSAGPMMTAPPPEVPLASEPIVADAASPSLSVAPTSTLKAGLKEEAFTVPLEPLMVKVAALPMANE